MSAVSSPLSAIGALLESAGVDYAVIGAHAVNVFAEPRFTADIDLTISAGASGLARLDQVLSHAGYVRLSLAGGELASGPDFLAWRSPQGDIIEMQVAKTALQAELLRRAVRAPSGVRVASLCVVPEIDWAYVEHWAKDWDILERLARYRPAT